MNNDLISRSELKKQFSDNCLHNCYYCKLAKWDKKGACYNCGLIDNAPTVEYTFEEAFQKTVCEQKLYCPARPQGEWICKPVTFGTCILQGYECNCGRVVMQRENFCPECGAEMGGEENGK